MAHKMLDMSLLSYFPCFAFFPHTASLKIKKKTFEHSNIYPADVLAEQKKSQNLCKASANLSQQYMGRRKLHDGKSN